MHRNFKLQNNTVFGQFTEFSLDVANMHQRLGTAGVKWSPGPTSLISGNVVFPITEHGLTDNLTVVVGVDVSF